MLRIRGGRVLTSHHFLLEDRLESDTPAFLAQLLREYYPLAGDVAPAVLLSHDVPDAIAWEERFVRPARTPRPPRSGRSAGRGATRWRWPWTTPPTS